VLALRPLAQLCAVLRAAADPQRVTLAYADGGVDAYDSPARDALAATLYAAAAAARAPELAPFLGLSEVTPSLPPSLLLHLPVSLLYTPARRNRRPFSGCPRSALLRAARRQRGAARGREPPRAALRRRKSLSISCAFPAKW
jgi:hypothetical protein